MSYTVNSFAIAENLFVKRNPVRVAGFMLAILGGVALIAVSAKVQVPFWPVPMTLQTLAIMAIFAAYGLRLSLATIIAYLAAGFAGFSVFAGPVAGPAYFAGPTVGFLVGFVIAAAIVGYGADQGWAKNPFKLFATMVLADVAVFALGFLWLGFMFVSAKSGNTLGAAVAFKAGVQPYILADLVKIALASALIPALHGLLKPKQ